MKKLSTLLLAGACLAAASQAGAATLTIDNFNSNDQSVSDLVVGSGAVSGTAGNRTLSQELFAGSPPISSSSTIAGVSYGMLDIANGTGEKSEVVSQWQLGSNLIPFGATNVTLNLTVLLSDTNPVQLDFLMNATELLPAYSVARNSSNLFLSFNLDNDKIAQINSGGAMQLRINGDAGWDASFDDLSISYTPAPDKPAEVPVPGVLSLVALGALGLRKKRR